MPWLRSLLAFGLLVGGALAADWPQWLGPTRDGATPEKVEPWKGELKVLWRKPVGEGHSSPVVANGLAILHFKLRDQDAEVVQAYHVDTGLTAWQSSYPTAAYKGMVRQWSPGDPECRARPGVHPRHHRPGDLF